MAGSKDVMDVAEADRSDEAWIRTANSDQSVRIRSLTMILQRGATLTDVRLIEQDDETWSIWFRPEPGQVRRGENLSRRGPGVRHHPRGLRLHRPDHLPHGTLP